MSIAAGNSITAADVNAIYSGYWIIEQLSYSYTNLASGATLKITGTNFGLSNLPATFVPMCAVRISTGNSSVQMTGFNVSNMGSSNSVLKIRNFASSSKSGTANIYILYLKVNTLNANAQQGISAGSVIYATDVLGISYKKAYSYSYTVASKSYLYVTATNLGFSTPTGYAPGGIAHITSSVNDVVIGAFNFNTTGSNTCLVLRNLSSS